MKPKYYATNRLYTKRLFLERFTQNDLQFFLQIAGEATVTNHFSSWKNKQERKEYFENEILKNVSCSDTLFLVIRKTNGTSIGLLNLFACNKGLWIVEYAILEEHRRQGYMKEILLEILQNLINFSYTFDINDMDFSWLQFDVDMDNIASQELLKSVSKALHIPAEYANNRVYFEIANHF